MSNPISIYTNLNYKYNNLNYKWFNNNGMAVHFWIACLVQKNNNNKAQNCATRFVNCYSLCKERSTAIKLQYESILQEIATALRQFATHSTFELTEGNIKQLMEI